MFVGDSVGLTVGKAVTLGGTQGESVGDEVLTLTAALGRGVGEFVGCGVGRAVTRGTIQGLSVG